MIPANEKKISRYQFTAENITSDPELEKMANLKLAQLLALAPKDALAAARVENSGRYYVAVAEVKSRFRNFEEKSAGSTPYSAVRRALERLEDRLYRWRFGGGTDASAHPVRAYPLTQLQG